MKPEQIKTLKKFVNDPEWAEMERLIIARLELRNTIDDIDTSKPDSVIIGEIVHRKKTLEVAALLKRDFEIIRNYDPDKPPKKTLK